MLRLKSWMKTLSWVVIIGVPLWFIVAALGSKFGVWSWQFGLMKMTGAWGKPVMFTGLGIGVVALIVSLIKAPRKIDTIMAAIIAIIIPVMAMANGKGVSEKAAALPFIHDISTDTQNPPMFTQAILSQRKDAPNPTDYVGKKDPRGTELVSVLQERGYPDIKSQSFSQSREDVAAAARAAMVAEFGRADVVIDATPGVTTLESTDTTFWYGFKDDVIVRVREDVGKTIVDMRSLSRVGGSDLGANADRIRALQAALAAKLEE